MPDEIPMRFFLEETSFELPAGLDFAAIERCLEAFVGLMRARHEQAHEVFRWSRLDEIEVRPGTPFCDLLYQEVASLPIDHDLRKALQEVINRCVHWDERVESAPPPLVDIAGVSCTSPTGALVHALLSAQHGIACLSPGARAERAGPVSVRVGAVAHEVYFITDEAHLPLFYRTLFEVEDLDADAYMENAPFAFPQLIFAPGLASQFVRFATPYSEVRSHVTKHLSVLNDHFQRVHKERKDTTDAAIGAYGIDASLERGKTHKNKAAMKQRTVAIDGVPVVCEWHTKIKRHEDRIYFDPGDPKVAGGRLVVGHFAKHFDL